MVAEKESRELEPTGRYDLFKIYLDIYKHHFELWLKGYIAYLAIIGATAGFVFVKDTPPQMDKFLLMFVGTVSVISMFAWSVGLKWVRDFSAAVKRVTPSDAPPLALAAFRTGIVLGLLGSIVILAGTLVLYSRGV